MDAGPNMKQELSILLDAELKKQLTYGENVLVSLPGSFGEALAVTDRRVIVLRDCEGGVNSKCDVHNYALAGVTGAEAVSSGMGGHIELKLAQPVESPDAARVYFPSYDLAKFQAAADYITKVVTEHAQAAAAAPPSAAASPVVAGSTVNCPNCDAAVSDDAVFCRSCGHQLLVRCTNCGGASPVGSAFCESCGTKFEEFPVECRKCGARVTRWQAYCTECGSIQHATCAACGAQVSDNWKYCASCGRQLGAGGLDPRSSFARRLQDRARQAVAAESTSTSIWGSAPAVETPSTPEPTPAPAEPAAPAAPVAPPGSAEDHNQRGRQLFDDGDNEGAIREFQAAVNMDPNNASYHCNLAIAYDENEQDEEALAEYEQTLHLDPNDLTALLSLGYMYNENEEPDKAQQAWNRILQTAPDSAEAQEVKENLSHQSEL